ncbi:MAG: hypothetical protein EOO75_12465, partial [Myxococcales bacterium]
MSSAADSLDDAPARLDPRWRGLIEFLVTGGATLALFPVAWLSRWRFGLDEAEFAFGFLTFHAAFLINDPHFGVTYLLFYRDARRRAFGPVFGGAQRVRYWVAGLVVPAALVAWAAVALGRRSAPGIGWMIQLMFGLVGWHYVKQGFGLLAVLSARRGVQFSPIERRALLAHCLAGWAYAWASPFEPGRVVEEKGVVYTALAHGAGLELVTLVVFLASAVGALGALAWGARRRGRLPPLAPLSGFLITVWLWTVYSSLDPLMIYVIPALHSVQYLYFVWLMRRNQARETERPPHFGRPVGTQLGLLALSALAVGWVLFHGAPELLDGLLAPRATRAHPDLGDLGPTPYFAAVIAVVNIHHYFM